MRKGEFTDGTRVLRARIDKASPNIKLLDPEMYLIVNDRHHRTRNRWSI